MAYEEATDIVNDIHRHLARLARGIVTVLDDNKVSGREALLIGIKGMSTAEVIMDMLKLTMPEVRKDILYVLEHGEWGLPGPANVES